MEVGEQRMRVIGGQFASRIIAAPPGRATRPTQDRVREGLFSRLDAYEALEGAQVLDAFAGSGALGIEAISRGAAHVTLVESDARAMHVLKSNLHSLGIEDFATVYRGDALAAGVLPLLCKRSYSLILLDPPYRIDKSKVKRFIANLDDAGALEDGAFVAWEHDASSSVDWPSRFVSLGGRVYGTTEIDIAVYRKEEE